ncbi:hypothetical protein WHX55_22615 [Pseudomonas fluorescens]|uniref:hypothetical protein n=1 Tax=Pseudomonas fluorescens TaxID=294 RepID=UPI003254FBD5
MSDDFDVDEMSAELTGSVGVPEDAVDSDSLPVSVADSVDEYNTAIAEKDLRMTNDVEDSAAGDAEREGQRGKRTVPLAALHEERTKRQELQQQLAAHQQQLQLMQQQQLQWQQYQQQLAQMQQQQAEADAIPAFEDDPQGHIEGVKNQFRQELENLRQGQAQQQAAADFQREVATVMPAAVAAEAQFRESNPDYDEAFNIVQSNVESQLRQLYPQVEPAAFNVLKTVALVQFTKQCQASGRDPCQHIYDQAQQMGWTPGRRVPGVQSQGYQVAAQPRVSPNTSLSNLSGSPRAPDEKGKLTAAQINDMDDAQFNELFEQMGRASHVGLKF